jgi:hypothetical protein
VALTVLIVTVVSAAGKADLAEVRQAAAQFDSIEVAEAAGYTRLPGLDHCFDNPGVGGMGYHYIDADSLDLTVDPLQPEAMVYVPGLNGEELKLGAVEYLVPAAEWDATGHSEPPSVLGHSFHLNENLGMYVLHAWFYRYNPAGMFEDWNPTVSCPIEIK